MSRRALQAHITMKWHPLTLVPQWRQGKVVIVILVVVEAIVVEVIVVFFQNQSKWMTSIWIHVATNIVSKLVMTHTAVCMLKSTNVWSKSNILSFHKPTSLLAVRLFLHSYTLRQVCHIFPHLQYICVARHFWENIFTVVRTKCLGTNCLQSPPPSPPPSPPLPH